MELLQFVASRSLWKAQELLVKTVVRELLAKLNQEKLVLDWRNREAARAGVRDAIRRALDEGLPDAYDGPLLQDKAFKTYPSLSTSIFLRSWPHSTDACAPAHK